MKIKKEKLENKNVVTFIPETEEEKRIMGSLRNHYFFGLEEKGTYPKYDGITMEDNFVTSMKFSFNNFE